MARNQPSRNQPSEILKFRADLEDIINLAGAGVYRISMCLNPSDIWFLPGDIRKIRLKSQPQHIEYRNN